MSCPSDDRLNTYLAGQLEPWEAATIEQHVATCPTCPAVIEAHSSLFARGSSELRSNDGDNTREPGRVLAPGDKVGDYVLLHRIGAGGMGVVWAAYDPLLDRQLAIKLLGDHAHASRSLRARFEREARITAKLLHPAIVHIQEAGTHAGEPYYVMKLVGGKSLDSAIAERTSVAARLALVPNVTAIVDAIAYAHEAGVLHRDLKPQNVMVGEFGETVVIDWGLASTTKAAAAAAATDAPTPDSTMNPSGVLGTPSYMPPEQASGLLVDHRADIYALGAILYQVIVGKRPYANHTPAATLVAVLDGPPEPLATLAPDAPHDLRTIAETAMAREPADRYATARQLADELKRFSTGQMVGAHRYSRHERARRWVGRHRTVLTLGTVVALAGAATAGLARDATVADTRCSGMEHRLAGVWDPFRAATVRVAFIASGAPHGTASADRVVKRLDDYGHDWTAVRVEACEATHRRGEQSEALLDLRMQCLDRKRSALNALASLLDGDVSRDAVDRAIQSTAQLAPVADCSDGTALLAAFPAPPLPLVPAVQAAQHDLDAAVALESLGRYREAVAAIETLAPRARNLAYPPLTAAVHYWHARTLRLVTDYVRAEAIARTAIATAATAKDDTLAADSWFELLHAMMMQNKSDEAAKLDSFAAVAVARAGNTPVLQARLLNVQGSAAFKQLDLKTARARYERSLALGDRNDPRQWVNVMNLGMLSQREGKFADAKRVFEELVAQYERELGPDHPETARVLYNLALAQQSLGELAEARTSCERSLRIRTASLGAEDPRTAESIELLGQIMSRQGDPQAETQLRRAVQIKEKLLGPKHADVARMLGNLADVIQREGKLDEATELHRRALAIKLEVYGPKHPHTAYSLHGLGVVLADRGDCVAARPYLADALESFTAAHGPDHPTLAYVLVGLGRCDLELGHIEQAVIEAERALAIREKSQPDPEAVAEASFLLGRAMWAAKRRDRATQLVKRARELYETAGPGAAPELAKVNAWSLAHRS